MWIVPHSMALARRDCLNNPDARAKMVETVRGPGRLADIPAKSTRGYGMSDIHRGMTAAACPPPLCAGLADVPVRSCPGLALPTKFQCQNTHRHFLDHR